MKSTERVRQEKKKTNIRSSSESISEDSYTDAFYPLHRHRNGEVRISINPDGESPEPTPALFGSARSTIADAGQLSATGNLQKYITQYGVYAFHIYLRMFKDLIYWKEKGIAHTVKTAIRLPLTVGISVFGGFLPSLIGSSESGFECATRSLFWFLSEEASSALVVFLSVIIVTAYGGPLIDKVLSGIFNRILNTPDTVLHFTEAEKEAIMASPDISAEQKAHLESTIAFLQGEYEKSANKYQDFKHRGDHHVIQRSAEKLRLGNPKQLLSFALYIRDKKGVSMSLKEVEEGVQDTREYEMLFAEKVLQDFKPLKHST